MKFRALQDSLRRKLLHEVAQGKITGLRLAEQTGFRQAHISNFLNGKRQLSLEGMDRVLAVRGLSVLDLLDPREVNKRAQVPPSSDHEFANVFLVEERVAATEALVLSMMVKETLKFRTSFLRRLRPDCEEARLRWERFVTIRMSAREGMSMYPRLLPGATVLIDRHYTALKPYRRNELNMYAVRTDNGCKVKYVEVAGDNLILRPHNQDYAVEIVSLEPGSQVSDYIVGRVCYVGIET
jgi:transcriptional regulator with XRE-family HTH domain